MIKPIKDINHDPIFHGILVQLPILPNHINSNSVIFSIDPKQGCRCFIQKMLFIINGYSRFIPCTPKGIMKILEFYEINLKGKHVVVLGRSNIVGSAISILTSLKSKWANSTTTICHSGSEILHHILRMQILLL